MHSPFFDNAIDSISVAVSIQRIYMFFSDIAQKYCKMPKKG
jgi:hypothetical protein